MPSQNPNTPCNVANTRTVMDGWTDGPTDRKIIALAHPYQVGKSCSKLSEILPSALGGNRVQTDRQ